MSAKTGQLRMPLTKQRKKLRKHAVIESDGDSDAEINTKTPNKDKKTYLMILMRKQRMSKMP